MVLLYNILRLYYNLHSKSYQEYVISSVRNTVLKSRRIRKYSKQFFGLNQVYEMGGGRDSSML